MNVKSYYIANVEQHLLIKFGINFLNLIMFKFIINSSLLFLVLLIQSCSINDCDEPIDEFSTTPYSLEISSSLPPLDMPLDNPLTEEGVSLGRMLFYEPLLSRDGTQSCSSCHRQATGFSDLVKFSYGIDGDLGVSNAMDLFNIAWSPSLNWDGSSVSLEDQAFEPIRNPIEMHDTWINVSDKLNAHSEYPDLFKAAFNIDQIDSNYVVKAIAQFERTLISGNSKWDKWYRGEVSLNRTRT